MNLIYKTIQLFPDNFKKFFCRIVILLVEKYFKLKGREIVIRENTTDLQVFGEIFWHKEFALPVKINPKLIIDAGAYVGFSTLYFSSKYPQAKIFALEPENSNFEVLEKNVEGIKNVKILQEGLWNKKCFLKILDRGTGKWGFTAKEVKENEKWDVKSATINNLLRESGFEKIDILKLDIEGAEEELFSKNYEEWLGKVKVIIIELHDRIKPNCTKNFYEATGRHNWDEYRKGEKVILIKRDD